MSLVCSGDNSCHKLGVPLGILNFFSEEVSKITKVPVDAANIRCITSGIFYTIVVMKDGSVLAAGDCNGLVDYKKFTKINVCDENVKWAVTVDYFTIFLTESGSLVKLRFLFEEVPMPNKATSIFAASEELLGFIDDDGDVNIFKHGLKDDPNKFSFPSPAIEVVLCRYFCVVLLNDGSVYGNGYLNSSKDEFGYLNSSKDEFCRVRSLEHLKIKKITGNFNTCLALDDEGKVYSYGDNLDGQFGNGTTESCYDSFCLISSLGDKRIKDIACSDHSLFLTEDGKLYGCGESRWSQLFQKTKKDKILSPILLFEDRRLKSVFVGESCSFALLSPNDDLVEKQERKIEDLIMIDSNSTLQEEIKKSNDENSNMSEITRELRKVKEENELLRAKLNEQESVHKKPKILRTSGLSVEPSRFKEIKSIGRGRSGEVFLVEECETGIKYAMKKYFVSDFGENENEGKRFIREIDFGASVDHPCVVKFIGFFFPTPQNPPTLFFEYARNGTLKDMLEGKSSKFNSTHRALCVVEICMGMVYLHANGIIHRDLKPSNILVTDWKHFKISDFSESTLPREDETMTAGVGSQFFQSPEIINGFEYDSKTDVFSFGVILFMIMTGEVPKIPMIEFLNGKRAQIPPDITRFVAELISSCWAHLPEKRPSFSSILETLRLNDFMIFPDVDADVVHERYEQVINNH